MTAVKKYDIPHNAPRGLRYYVKKDAYGHMDRSVVMLRCQ